MKKTSLLWTGLWLAVVAVAMFTRPFLPVDETRYLAVAWDMWRTGDYLVPHLNGEIYSHKPPLLFWLINLGWGIFGVNEWWSRLVAPMFGLGCLFLTARLARDLWPGRESIPAIAPLLLFGGLFWALFTTLTMFDMILAFCTLLALVGIVDAWKWRGEKASFAGFWLFGLGIGLGILTKGPAILLHTLPLALSAPWWGSALAGVGAGAINKGRWYAGVGLGVGLGVAIGLAWAVPAGMAGGEAYRDAIFWGQSAGRIVSSFAHKQPWWFYGAALPVMLLPWLLWPPSWRALKGMGRLAGDGGARLCLVWIISSLVVFTAISGKQFHYLLPELPAIALILARLLVERDNKKPMPPIDQAVPGLFAVIMGTVLIGLPTFAANAGPAWLKLLGSGWGLLLVVAGFAVVLTGNMPMKGRIGAIAVLSGAFVVVGHLALKAPLAAVYDLKPLAMQIAEWQRQGIAVANFSKYHGQYNFLGRLKKPVTQVGMLHPDTEKFVKANPKGLIIAYHETLPQKDKAAKPIAIYRFRTRLIAVWQASVVALNPGITER